MVPEEICKLLSSEFGDAVLKTVVEGGHPYAEIAAERWPDVALFLRDDPRLGLNFLRCISGLDMIADDKLACIYDVNSISLVAPTELITETCEFSVRVTTDRSAPHLPTVSQVWAVFSARYIIIAPLSNTVYGLPSGPSESIRAGILLFGLILRKSGSNCSPLVTFTGCRLHGMPSSSIKVMEFLTVRCRPGIEIDH